MSSSASDKSPDLNRNYTEHCKTSMVYCRIRVRSERATNCSLKRRLCADKGLREQKQNLLLQDKPIPEGNNKIIEKHKEQQPRRLKFLNRTVLK